MRAALAGRAAFLSSSSFSRRSASCPSRRGAGLQRSIAAQAGSGAMSVRLPQQLPCLPQQLPIHALQMQLALIAPATGGGPLIARRRPRRSQAAATHMGPLPGAPEVNAFIDQMNAEYERAHLQYEEHFWSVGPRAGRGQRTAGSQRPAASLGGRCQPGHRPPGTADAIVRPPPSSFPCLAVPAGAPKWRLRGPPARR